MQQQRRGLMQGIHRLYLQPRLADIELDILAQLSHGVNRLLQWNGLLQGCPQSHIANCQTTRADVQPIFTEIEIGIHTHFIGQTALLSRTACCGCAFEVMLQTASFSVPTCNQFDLMTKAAPVKTTPISHSTYLVYILAGLGKQVPANPR